MKAKKIIVFEEVKSADRWLIRWYRMTHCEIFYLHLAVHIQEKNWVKTLVKRHGLNSLLLDTSRMELHQGYFFEKSFENMDALLATLKNRPLLKRIAELYAHPSLDMAFKNGLHEKLARFYYLAWLFEQLSSRFPDRDIAFLPSNGIAAYRSRGREVGEFQFFSTLLGENHGMSIPSCSRVEFARWKRWEAVWQEIFDRVWAWGQWVLFGLYAWLQGLKSLEVTPIAQKQFQLGIHITSPERQFTNHLQNVAFLLDCKSFTKENTVFISYRLLKSEHRILLESRGLKYIDRMNSMIHREDVRKIFSIYSAGLNWKESFILRDLVLKLLYYYLRWSGFMCRVKLERLISHCDYGMQSVARNLILEKNGCTTFYYLDSGNFGCFFEKEGSTSRYRSLFGYLYFDTLLSWNESLSQYFLESGCRFRRIRQIGCLWASHVRMAEQKGIAFRSHIAVFDTTYHDCSITPYEDGLKFLQGILAVLECHPELTMTFKEKKSRSFHVSRTDKYDELITLYERIAQHPRVRCIHQEASSAELIAGSDIVVAFPFTSPVMEALAAGKRAVWFDAGARFRDTVFDKIPGLVVHSAEELSQRLEVLLNISQTQYNEFMERWIKDTIDPYLDGKGLDRLRRWVLNPEEPSPLDVPAATLPEQLEGSVIK